MLRRRLAPLATIGAGVAMLVGCSAQAPSVTTAEPAEAPPQTMVEVVAAYAVGEHDGVVYTAMEAEEGGWCLGMHHEDDIAGATVICTPGEVVQGGSEHIAMARLEVDGLLGADDGTAISDWVVVLD